MNGFLDQLGVELHTLAESHATHSMIPATPGPLRGRASRRRRTVLTLATTSAVVVALGTLPWVAERTEPLRPLDAPVANAAAHAGRPGVPPASSYDLLGSRTFPTPDGVGFVVNSKDGRRRCLVVPDRNASNTFGSSCRPFAEVARDGMLGEMVQAQRGSQDGRTLAAFVLPRGASPDVVASSRGMAVPVAVTGGVAVLVTSDRTTISYRVRGLERSKTIPAPFVESGKAVVRCADGNVVEFDLPGPQTPGRAPARLHTADLCD